MMTSTDLKTAEPESLRELHAPDADPLAPVEMGPADRETKGGIWGSLDIWGTWQR